jgi:hypothetical protein
MRINDIKTMAALNMGVSVASGIQEFSFDIDGTSLARRRGKA